MITMNAPNLPPRLPSSDAIEAAHALIALITDPAAAKANLDAILAAKASLDEATAANTAAAKEAQDAAAALAGVQAHAADLADSRGRANRGANPIAGGERRDCGPRRCAQGARGGG